MTPRIQQSKHSAVSAGSTPYDIHRCSRRPDSCFHARMTPKVAKAVTMLTASSSPGTTQMTFSAFPKESSKISTESSTVCKISSISVMFAEMKSCSSGYSDSRTFESRCRLLLNLLSNCELLMFGQNSVMLVDVCDSIPNELCEAVDIVLNAARTCRMTSSTS